MFEQALLTEGGRTSRPVSVGLSMIIQVGLVGTALLIPLFFIEPLPKIPLQMTQFVPRRVVELVDPVVRRAGGGGGPVINTSATVSLRPRVFQAPTSIPMGIALIDDGPFNYSTSTSGNGPLTPGIGPIGDSFSVLVQPPPKQEVVKPVAPPSPTAPVQVGGLVKPPVLLSSVQPAYPQIARSTRVSGVVKLEAVISKIGIVESIRVISGHPLLINAAREAVAKWKYQPTLLNGQPVDVMFAIDVNFTLNP